MNTNTVNMSAEQARELNNALRALRELSPETASILEVQAGLNFARIQKLSSALGRKADIIGVNVQELVRTFLSRFHSPSTQATYMRAISLFTDWAQKRGIHPLEISGTDADNYAAFVSQAYSPRTANTYINAVSSLYAWLAKREHIRATPFIYIKRNHAPAKKVVPSESDIAQACACASDYVAQAIRVLSATGLRIGAITHSSAKIVGTRFTSITKRNKPIAITVNKDIACLLRQSLNAWKTERANTLSVAICRAFRAVGVQGSAHGLRHAFAIRLYTESNNNIELVRRALGHSNIAITTTYLQSLDCLNIDL